MGLPTVHKQTTTGTTLTRFINRSSNLINNSIFEPFTLNIDLEANVDFRLLKC